MPDPDRYPDGTLDVEELVEQEKNGCLGEESAHLEEHGRDVDSLGELGVKEACWDIPDMVGYS